MPLTHPMDFPDSILPVCTITLDDGYVQSTYAKGRKGVQSQIIDPLWRGSFSTGGMMPARRGLWESWKNSIMGRAFLAWDVSYPEPLAYMQGHPATIAGTWAGGATLTGLTQTTLSLSGLPAGYQFTEGDRIGLTQNGRRGYYGVIETRACNGSGAISALAVSPFVNPVGTAIFTTAAAVTVRRPKLLMTMDAGSWTMDVDRYDPSASFTATQVI